MGGGNAQKSAMARERNAAKAGNEANGGGGSGGMSARGGDTAAKIAASQADKAEKERKKAELAEKKKAAEEKEKKRLEKEKKALEKAEAEKKAAAKLKKEMERQKEKEAAGGAEGATAKVDVSDKATEDATEAVAALDVSDGAAAGKEGEGGDDVDYGEHLKIHMQEALNSVLTTLVEKEDKKKDPFRAIQQVLFQASLTGETPSPAKLDITPAMQKFMDYYNLEVLMDSCTFKLKKRLTKGPKEGVKFLISDAGDFFTEESKKLKTANYVMASASMTAEELAAKDAADKKAKREKEAQAEKERDEADAKNAERAAALEASGKKATGGLHKFDASEVDVHGGNATADDFMDAFGF